MEELLVVVDEQDNPLYPAEKIKVHKLGLLHRAFSIFVFDYQFDKLLIQQRHPKKYHSGGLWANTTCGHPRWNEPLEKAAHRRLKEEMGFDTELKWIFKFHYKVNLDNGMIENEIDHIFIGNYGGEVVPNPEEVINFKWAGVQWLKNDISKNPENYVYWFRILLPMVLEYLQKNFNYETDNK